MHLPLCMNDITVFAPPCMTPKRAFEVYDTAFRRVVEYVTLARIPGDVLEFGTFRGYTARTLAALMKEWNNPSQLYLYDSWEGFPEMVGNDAECPEVKIHGTWKRGDCNPGIGSAGILIQNILRMLLPNRVHAIPGYYEKTVPAHLPKKASIVHIDCDLYSSTHHVLSELIKNDVFSDGTVVLFDEFNNNFASNKYGERRVMRDIFPVYRDGERWMDKPPGLSLEPWFTYGFSGYAFILHRHDGE